MKLNTSLFSLLLTFSSVASMPAKAQAGGCAVSGIADLKPPTHWLGVCINGHANGLGVARAGAAAPFGFFAGRMAAGRPEAGVIILRNGLFEVATSFNKQGRPIGTDSLHPEQQDVIFSLAARAARNTADRFSRTGNAASADYYRRLARRIQRSLPE